MEQHRANLVGGAEAGTPCAKGPRNPYLVSALLFGSGFAGLVYQIVWLREMRLVFGASTAASAAVLAIFMGGLGLGGALLGRRADRSANPLRFYSSLEFGAALCAFVSPYLLDLTRAAYVGLGGVSVLGAPLATLARLALSALVLAAPTILMGGALPAAARAVESESDLGRRRLALLYGCNTLGGVLGAVLATFALLELLGTRDTLLVACCVNALVALTARSASRSLVLGEVRASLVAPSAPSRTNGTPRAFAYAAAAVVGFAFFIMELAWYRMLGPLLGGSTYTFGLILGVALLGVGLGGALYSARQRGKASTLLGFGLTCGLEALCIAFPYALGDRLAIFAAFLQPLGSAGLAGAALGWTLVTLITVFPASLVAGYQFPLLINLLGVGENEVGQHTGNAYAWNTVGAILGALAGGFVLLPLLSALGVWKAVVYGLGLLGAAALVLSLRRESRGGIAGVALVILAAWGLLLAEGPSAAWRHSPIGAGRVDLTKSDVNGIRRWRQDVRRETLWEAEGLESSVAISGSNGFSFHVNGKSDGNVKGDAPTQVMLGLVSAILHPQPRTGLVIGLGTGCSAGWLAETQGMERVDVAELEPAILEVARRSAPANYNVLQHPKARVILGDARELLLTTRERYDLIVSEPSNPYRAGIASLFTREFYQAVAERLQPGGIFSQWVQGYEVDTETVLTICATLRSVFPHVQVWRTMSSDMLFVCSKEALRYDLEQIKEKIQHPPLKDALLRVWGGADLEAFFAHHIANESFTRALVEQSRYPIPLSTDNAMTVEFGFARSVGRGKKFSLEDLRRAARERRETLPQNLSGTLDAQRLNRQEILSFSGGEQVAAVDAAGAAENQTVRNAYKVYAQTDLKAVREAWKKNPWPLYFPVEYGLVARSLADVGDAAALPVLDDFRRFWPGEADVVEAQLKYKQGDINGAFALVEKVLTQLRNDPWLQLTYMMKAIDLLEALAKERNALDLAAASLLSKPFCVNILDKARQLALIRISERLGCERLVAAFSEQEPFPFWEGRLLHLRQACYRERNVPNTGVAQAEFLAFTLAEAQPFSLELFTKGTAPTPTP